MNRYCLAGATIATSFLLASSAVGADATQPRLLFLGDQGHHQPVDRFNDLQPALSARGIELEYAEGAGQLHPANLAKFDGLIVYANITEISPEQEAALLEYVAGGKGFIPIHCASYCFLNSPKYIELVGAQFQRHDTGIFRTELAKIEHPILAGYGGFESWDETYTHHLHNERDRTVLEYRAEGGHSEPWTWVRTHGEGRVFYTAWGHDQRTWGHPGFVNLIERGIRWAIKSDVGVPEFTDAPAMTELGADSPPFEFVPAKIPFYPAGERWGTIGEPIAEMQKPLPAEESMQHFVTPVGFKVELFASEPEIGKPLAMAWDERGRLWLAETRDYPNEMQRPGEGRDAIRICEDTDGDGRADKFTIFADKLSIPTSIAFAAGGLVVQQAPQTLLLKDTDGDDVADERIVLFDGWNTEDTHAGPSSLRYGIDNWLWGMVGYAGFRGEVASEQVSFRQGFCRFTPDGQRLEFVRSQNNNCWGVGFSEEGLVFGSTANGNPSTYMPIANRVYEAVRGWSAGVLEPLAPQAKIRPITENVRQVDWHGGYTAAAGHALYTARAWPASYWNRTAFVCEPTGHVISTFLLERRGSDFASRNAWNLLASDDGWSSPIAAEVGPDGQVWVIDWYNYIVQHNPTPAGYTTGKGNAYETDLRDKTRGRIYRVVYEKENAKPVKKSLAGASPEELVAALADDNMFWRLHAQRLLVERGKLDVAPLLVALIDDPSADALGLNPGALHALWTLHGLGAFSQSSSSEALSAAVRALEHPSAGVRRAAAIVMPRTPSTAERLAARVADDSDPHVRLAALLAIAECPSHETLDYGILEALQTRRNLADKWIRDALAAAGAAHAPTFLRRAKLAEATTPEALRIYAIVAEHFARSDSRQNVAELLAALREAPPAIGETIVGGFAKGWPRDESLGEAKREAADEALGALLEKLSPAGQGQAIQLATRWGSSSFEEYSKKIAESLLETLADEDRPDAERIGAARRVVELLAADDATAESLLDAVTPRSSPALAAGMIDALSSSRAPGVGAAIVARVRSMTPAAKAAAMRVLLARTENSAALLDGLENNDVTLADLSLDQKQALAAHPDTTIAARAAKLLEQGGALPNADRQKVLEELAGLAKVKADPVAGKEVFKKQCAKCHKHSGEGENIGPDLSGMAAHTKQELLTSILDPSRSVEGNFRVYSVSTADGRVLTGLLAAESRTAIELYDAEAKKHVVLREDIEELTVSPKSLMPEGFEKQVPPEDIANLLEFLTQRGKYLPLPIAKQATIVSTKGMFYSEAAPSERLVFSDWGPKTFEGVPFTLVDPKGDSVANVIMLHGPHGAFPPKMPKEVMIPCHGPAKAIHLLSGVSGWGAQGPLEDGTVSMIVRLKYESGETEDHPLYNGRHFADYIGAFEVPESKLAFKLRGQQIRYLAIEPKRGEPLESISFVKGPDSTAPVVMAVTVETADGK